eukprot:COSAG05_NODE_2312_length_3243_cov_2.859097_3_plen_53_part_00
MIALGVGLQCKMAGGFTMVAVMILVVVAAMLVVLALRRPLQVPPTSAYLYHN